MNENVLPDIARRVAVFADNGAAGEAAAEKAAAEFHRQGKRVTIRRPADEFPDFNDVLKVRSRSAAA